jgi:hypothetical protein
LIEATAPLFGVSAEFASPDALLAAAVELRARALGRIDAYSPVPVPGMETALGLHSHAIRPFALAGAVAGFVAFMAMCAYATGYAYVFDIGGRPAVSWASYVVPSFSFGMMTAAFLVAAAFTVLNRLPRLNHPAFNIPDFSRASHDRFFLIVEAGAEGFDPARVERALKTLPQPPLRTSLVPR